MGKILIDEKEYAKLLRARYALDTLDVGGVDEWEGYDRSFQQDLDWWNEEHPEEQYKYWSDMAEAAVDTVVKEYKEKDSHVYLLWMEDIIINCFSSYKKAYEALTKEVNKDKGSEVAWETENYGITTVKTSWGEIVEYVIQELAIKA